MKWRKILLGGWWLYTPPRGDIVRFVRAKLGQDIEPDAMDRTLEDGILNAFPETGAEMYVGSMASARNM